MILGVVREANLLNFSGNVSVAQREQTGGKATPAPCDVKEKHHLVSKQSEFELPGADKAFELVRTCRKE